MVICTREMCYPWCSISWPVPPHAHLVGHGLACLLRCTVPGVLGPSVDFRSFAFGPPATASAAKSWCSGAFADLAGGVIVFVVMV